MQKKKGKNKIKNTDRSNAASTRRVAWAITKLALGCGMADRTKRQETKREKDKGTRTTTAQPPPPDLYNVWIHTLPFVIVTCKTKTK